MMRLLKKTIGLTAFSALLFIGGSSTGYADKGDGQGQNNQNNQNNQGQDSRFNGITDSGDNAHVLPTPDVLLGSGGASPSFGKVTPGKASVYPAAYGSGNLTNHGGPEIPSAAFSAVYWNSSVATSTQVSSFGTVSAQIQAFVQNFSGSPDYSIIQQYSASNPISSTVVYSGTLVDSKSTQSSISDSSIRNWLKGLFNAGRLTANANTVYGLYFPAGMRVSINFFQSSCTSFCGYHSSFSYNNTTIKYAVFPYLNCRGCSISGLTVGDMLTIVSSHEIREAVTDPLGNAWYDSSGYEADDKCVWQHLYQMASGGFWVQPEYSNGLAGTPGPGCVVP